MCRRAWEKVLVKTRCLAGSLLATVDHATVPEDPHHRARVVHETQFDETAEFRGARFTETTGFEGATCRARALRGTLRSQRIGAGTKLEHVMFVVNPSLQATTSKQGHPTGTREPHATGSS
jgi:hypothetical protein